MSAKDPRRAILLYLPPELRSVLRQIKAARRSNSTADALRVLVRRGLGAEGPLPTITMPVRGRPLRLQLPRQDLAEIAELARGHNLTSAQTLLALAARAAATMPQRR